MLKVVELMILPVTRLANFEGFSGGGKELRRAGLGVAADFGRSAAEGPGRAGDLCAGLVFRDRWSVEAVAAA